MKPIYIQTSVFFLSCFILCSLQSYAQEIEDSPFIERTYNQRYNTYSEDAVYYGEEKWVFGTIQQAAVSHPIGGYFFSTAILMMTNAEGDILWQTEVSNYEVSWIKDILVLQNGNIAVLSDYMPAHDVGQASKEIVLVNKEGEILTRFDFMEEDILGEDFFDSWSRFVEMLELDSENLLITHDIKSDDAIHKGIFQLNLLNGSLSQLKVFEEEDLEINDVFLDIEKNILVASNQGITKFDAVGNELYVSESKQAIFYLQDGIAAGLNELIYFDAELQYTQVHDLAASFSQLHFFEYSSDKIWLLGQNKDSDALRLESYLLSDFSTPLFTSYFGSSYVKPVNLQVSDNEIGVLGYEALQQTTHSFLKTFDKETGNQAETTVDIELEKVELFDFEEVLTPSGNQFFFLAEIQIKNLGADTLYQCYLNSYQNFKMRIFLGDFVLAPNETLTIDSLPFSAQNNIERVKEMCFWLTGSNDQLDRDYVNNTVCEPIILTNIENTLTFNESPFFQLFPNPAQQFTQISFTNPTVFNGKKVVLEAFNLQGQKIDDWQIDTVIDGWELQLANWNSGVYMLQLKVDGEVWAREKLVVLE
ncbi:MAG: T9SS type A sorting domain-containing protein [Chitinophagales bacterium]